MKYVVLLLAILLLPSIHAQLADATIDIIVVGEKAVVSKEYIFLRAVDFEEFLPEDAVAVEITSGDTTIHPAANPVSIPGALRVSISYVTQAFIHEENSIFFISDNALPFVANSVDLSITLPEGVRLTRPLSSPSASIIPLPDESQTDGQFLIFSWQRKNVDELPVFLSYKAVQGSSSIFTFLIILGIIFAIAAVLVSYILRDRGTKLPDKADFTQSHLKEDEITVINALKLKEGQTTQATLRVVTGFSKASLSRILKELEERNIVHKEQQGNKNLVTLREGEWNKLEQQ